MTRARFVLGHVVITPEAARTIPSAHVTACLDRHAAGDWGVSEPDENDQALRSGDRLLSAYPIDPTRPCEGWGDNCLWIITEADRSSTTILLPEEY